MLATVSMQPMARPASAMTAASTFTSRQKGMTANTREMVREEEKRAHRDWARLRSQRAEVRGGALGGPRGPPHPRWQGEEAEEEALSLPGYGLQAGRFMCLSLREQSPHGQAARTPGSP